jgi:ribosomal protein L11 methyltransferase
MRWYEFTLHASNLAAEAVMAILQDLAGGFASQDTPEGLVLWAWLPEDARLAERAQELRERLAGLPDELLEDGVPSLSERVVDEEDWAEAWKAYWQPQRVGERLVIKPTWRDWPPPDHPELARPDDLVIELDPGMAFGTGAHATTVLCLEALERALAGTQGRRVLDLGCGSGILSIAALKLGAAAALPIDADPLAIAATAENCARNGVSCRPLLQAGLDGLDGAWNIIVANISLPIILQAAPQAAALLAPGGRFICSGFYGTRAGEIVAALEPLGLEIESIEEREHWGCLVARKPAAGPGAHGAPPAAY